MQLQQASRVVERHRMLEREERNVRESIHAVDSALMAIESALQQANIDMVSCVVLNAIIVSAAVVRCCY